MQENTMENYQSGPPKWFWFVAVLAVVWNLMGVMAYVMHVTVSAQTLASMGEAERLLYETTPAWVIAAFAIAVFAGTAGSIALLLRQRWAIAAFALSLVGLFVQFGHTFFLSNAVEVLGAGIAAMPVLVTLIALLLFWFSRVWADRHWLR